MSPTLLERKVEKHPGGSQCTTVVKVVPEGATGVVDMSGEDMPCYIGVIALTGGQGHFLCEPNVIRPDKRTRFETVIRIGPDTSGQPRPVKNHKQGLVVQASWVTD